MDVSGEQTGDATSDVDVRASVGCIVLGRLSVAPVMWTSSSDTFGESWRCSNVWDWRKSVMSSISLFWLYLLGMGESERGEIDTSVSAAYDGDSVLWVFDIVWM